MSSACTNGVDTGFVALGYFKVAILGVVQGITELLPISSTAHMRLVPAVLGWQDPGSAFSAAMQLAALAAVVSYFWTDVRGLAVNSISAAIRGKFRDRSFQFALWIVLATVPIGIAGLALAKLLNTCNSPLRAVSVIGWACIAMAVASGDCRDLGSASAHDREGDHRRRACCGTGADRRAHSRRFPLGLDIDRGADARLQARRSRAPVVSAGSAGNRLGRASRSCGNSTRFISIGTPGRSCSSVSASPPFRLSSRSGA